MCLAKDQEIKEISGNFKHLHEEYAKAILELKVAEEVNMKQ